LEVRAVYQPALGLPCGERYHVGSQFLHGVDHDCDMGVDHVLYMGLDHVLYMDVDHDYCMDVHHDSDMGVDHALYMGVDHGFRSKGRLSTSLGAALCSSWGKVPYGRPNFTWRRS